MHRTNLRHIALAQADEPASEATEILPTPVPMSPRLMKTLDTLDEEQQARRAAEHAATLASNEAEALNAELEIVHEEIALLTPRAKAKAKART